MSQLRPGVGVNIVLKADQRSGKLTSGRIAQILTSGDHPRGIKVRLTNGSIGRVQSLSIKSESSITAQQISPASITHDTIVGPSEYSTQQSRRAVREGRRNEYVLHEDYTENPTPQQTRSLADYIKFPTISKLAPASHDSVQGASVQAQLEKEFPTLDTALIATILADQDHTEAARNVLSSLS